MTWRSPSVLSKAVGDGGSGGLVDDTEDVQAGDGTGILGSLALVVVEVGGDGDDGVGNLLAQAMTSATSFICEGQRGSAPEGTITLPRTIAEISSGEKVFFSPR